MYDGMIKGNDLMKKNRITAGLTAFLLSASCMAAVSVNAEESTVADTSEIIYGDLNSDGIADVTDLSILSLYLIGDTDIKDENALEAADIQYDGTVNLSDLAAFRQYLSKKTDVIGKKTNTRKTEDTTGSEVKGYITAEFGAGTSEELDAWMRKVGGTAACLVSSMEEYNEKIGSDDFAAQFKRTTGFEICEELFENHRLAMMTDNSMTVKGVIFELTSVKTD
jgi:hypothetical protein